MKQRRTMGIGQTICLSLLLVLLGASMFLPVFRFNGTAFESAVNKTVDYALDHMDKSKLGELYDQEQFEEAKKEAKEEAAEQGEEFEESIKEFEKENGVKIRQISAFRIMTNSLGKLLSGKPLTSEEKNEIRENEMLSKFNSKYNSLRIILWVIYMLAFVILIITILGSILHWLKFVTASIATVYGLAAVAVFTYLRFGMVGSIIKGIGNNTDLIDDLGMMDLTALSININEILKKMLPSFYSIGFLAGLILAVLVVVMSLISMLTGNQRKVPVDSWEEIAIYDGGNPFDVGGSNIGFEPVSTPDQYNMPVKGVTLSTSSMDLTATPTAPLPSVAPPPVVVPSPAVTPMPAVSVSVGQVKCTMGSAVGQGFRLPADRKVIIGKSPQNANLVINHPNVSNIHCSIRYNASNNTYIVKDHSMNGTFVNGVRMQKEVPMAYPAGTVLSLADGRNQVTLG